MVDIESSVTIVLLSCKDIRLRHLSTMNKQLLIVVLAMCLVSAHAFVKRDVPTTADLQAQLEALKNTLNQFTNSVINQTSTVINFDEIKKNLDKAIDTASKAVDSFVKPQEGAAQPAAQPAA